MLPTGVDPAAVTIARVASPTEETSGTWKLTCVGEEKSSGASATLPLLSRTSRLMPPRLAGHGAEVACALPVTGKAAYRVAKDPGATGAIPTVFQTSGKAVA